MEYKRKSMWVINHMGERIDIMDKNGIYPTEISGFGTHVTLNMSETAGNDGGTIVSSSVPIRPMTMTLTSNNLGDKLQIKKAFRAKKKAWLYYSNEFGKVTKIQFETEECEISPVVYPVTAEVTLQAEKPYFQSLDEIVNVLKGIKSYFKLPFSFPTGEFYISKSTTTQFTTITNESDVDIGYVVTIKASSAASNPSIMNVDTTEKMKLNFDMQAGDVITINTNKGKKSVTLLRNGIETDIINNIEQDFIFFPIYIGENLLKHDADSGLGALEIELVYSECYTLE